MKINKYILFLLFLMSLTSVECLFAKDKVDLPAGLEIEFSALYFIFKLCITCFSIFLLLAGARYQKASVGFLIITIGYLLIRSSSLPYIVQIIIILAILTILMSIYLLFPRIFMAFTMLLIIASGYLSYLYLTSNFNLNWILFSIFGTIAIAIGIIAPKFSVIILSSVQSVIHLMIQWDYMKSSSWFLMLIITGILIQSADYFVFSKSYKTPTLGYKERKERLPKELKLPIAVSTIIILTAFICLSLFSPRLEPVNDYYLNKFENISNAAIFNRPTIITNAEYNFYLYGRAVPISFISKNKSFIDRIKNIFIGRDICQDLKKFRVIKDEIEIGKIKKACEITSNAMEEAAKLIKPGINEKEIEEAILNKFKEQGVKRVAFKSIVASGKNALLPHYDKNNATLKNGFVVVDIGCMVDGYASDMTRTFPVMGKYNEGELELIQLVNKAKETAVKNLKPGVSIKDLNNKAKSIFEAKGLGKYYLHSLSHHVGINVHDPSEDILKPGMVITVEPGIYINEAAGIDKKYWNLGIRIEDTYLITKDGAIQLTNYPQIPFL